MGRLSLLLLLMIGFLVACAQADDAPINSEDETMTNTNVNSAVTPKIRVPAEWEPHAATWMQWPNRYEANLRPAFADTIRVIQAHEPVHLLTSSEQRES